MAATETRSLFTTACPRVMSLRHTTSILICGVAVRQTGGSGRVGMNKGGNLQLRAPSSIAGMSCPSASPFGIAVVACPDPVHYLSLPEKMCGSSLEGRHVERSQQIEHILQEYMPATACMLQSTCRSAVHWPQFIKRANQPQQNFLTPAPRLTLQSTKAA